MTRQSGAGIRDKPKVTTAARCWSLRQRFHLLRQGLEGVSAPLFNGVVLGDVLQAFREQRALGPVLAFDESLHGMLASLRQRYFVAIPLHCLFTQPRS